MALFFGAFNLDANRPMTEQEYLATYKPPTPAPTPAEQQITATRANLAVIQEGQARIVEELQAQRAAAGASAGAADQLLNAPDPLLESALGALAGALGASAPSTSSGAPGGLSSWLPWLLLAGGVFLVWRTFFR